VSHRALRRTLVRLLHDATLVERLHADPDAALVGVDVTPVERDWLLGVPRAAWRADGSRAARLVAGLAEEFPAAAVLAPERVETFVASDAFHRAIDDGTSLAAALGAHLATHEDALVAAVARLEAAIAHVRRCPSHPAASAPGALRLTTRAALVDVPAGVSTWREQVRDTGLSGPRPPAVGVEWLLVLRTDAGDVTVEGLSDELLTILTAATRPVPRDDLVALAESLGATADEAADIVRGLEADGLLR